VPAEDAAEVAAAIGRAARLIHAFRDPFRHALVGGDRFTDPLGARLVAGLHDIAAAGHANLFHMAFRDALADLATYFPAVRFANLPANGVAAFFAVRFADRLLHLAAMFVTVLFIHRPAHGVAAILLATTRNALAHAAFDVLDAALDARLLNDTLHIFPAAL
jgi:hypothetical protein